jgi:hypothetical protein
VRFHGTLLRTVAEQLEGGDDDAIDPAALDISVMPRLSWNFDLSRPPAGEVTRVWIEDGRVLVEGKFFDTDPRIPSFLSVAKYPCAGVSITERKQRADRKYICAGRLYEVGLSYANVDKGIEPIVLEDEQ